MKNQSNNKTNPDINDVMNENDVKIRNEIYNKYVANITPTHSTFLNIWHAFLSGGLICLIGQILTNTYMYFGNDKELATLYTTITLILLSATLTGLGIYAKLAKYSGAGTLVPITGFANSVVASAIEYKKEGQVFGIGCKIFIIAGPVILYGLFSSWVLGVIYWIWQTF